MIMIMNDMKMYVRMKLDKYDSNKWIILAKQSRMADSYLRAY